MFFFLVSFGALADVKPFATDYCTSYPEGTRQQPDLWKHCCVEHDLYFWAGGSLEERKETDLKLKECVEATGAHVQAQLIYTAVAMGTHSPIRFKTKQWGHSFEGRERYLKLSSQETSELIDFIESHSHPDLSPELLLNFKDTLNSRLD